MTSSPAPPTKSNNSLRSNGRQKKTRNKNGVGFGATPYGTRGLDRTVWLEKRTVDVIDKKKTKEKKKSRVSAPTAESLASCTESRDGYRSGIPGIVGHHPTSFDCVFTGFLPGFIGFYRVLPGFTGFYRVLPLIETRITRIKLISVGFLGCYWSFSFDQVVRHKRNGTVETANGGRHLRHPWHPPDIPGIAVPRN